MSGLIKTNQPSGARQYATFSVDGLFFGVEVLKVQEVLRFQEVTPVPRAAGVIKGLINLRGAIVTAFDMRRRLGLDDRASGEMSMNMVLRHDDGAVSLLVDEIGDVIEVSAEDFEPPPETIAQVSREMLEGVYNLPDRLLLVLSTEKVLQV